MSLKDSPLSSSFRDPEGFVFSKEGKVYRRILPEGFENYRLLMSSSLYQELVTSGYLISHEEIVSDSSQITLLPRQIPFISYPYEWSFSQLKDAALLTLSIQLRALQHGMSLKDASAFNVQFENANPVFIDTLSFEKYKEGSPWVAYGQFCRHFLAPLVLMKYKGSDWGQLLRGCLDGIPLSIVSKALPWHTRFNISLLTNIHMHAKAEKKFADKQSELSLKTISKQSLIGVITLLKNTIENLEIKGQSSEWDNYYDGGTLVEQATQSKKKILDSYLSLINPARVIDLGANTGLFSRLASLKNIFTIAADLDPLAVEKNYLQVKQNKETNILPLVIDLTNPSPSIGWDNEERDSFMKRARAEMVFALALIHHLCIGNNIPLPKLALFFSKYAPYLVIEFIPSDDTQVKWLMKGRNRNFEHYSQSNFEESFRAYFEILRSDKEEKSGRIMYLMKNKKEI